ncbi:MAG: hypothetical protein AMXMBFR7_18340 [Planctomycetota bacterium]
MGKWLLVLIVLASLGFIAVVLYFSAPEVVGLERTLTVQRTEIDRSARGIARVESVNHPVRMSFPVTGFLKSVKVKEGERVTQGDILAELEAEPFEMAVREAEAALAEAQARVAQLQAKPHPEQARQFEEQVKRAYARAEAAKVRLKELMQPTAPPPAADWLLEKAKREVELAAHQQNEAVYNQNLVLSRPSEDEKAIALSRVNLAQVNHETAKKKVDAGRKTAWPGSYRALAEWQIVEVEASIDQTKRQLEMEQALFDQAKRGASEDEKRAAKARAEAAQARYLIAVNELKRLQSPAAPPPAPAHEIELARLELAQAEATHREAQAAQALALAGPRAEDLAVLQTGVARAQAALEKAKAQRALTVLRAPFDGAVTGRFLEPGSAPPPHAAVLELADTSHLQVRAELDALWSAELGVGQSVELSGNVLPGGKIGGKIIRFIDEVGPKTLFSKDPTEPLGGEVVIAVVALDPPQSDDEKASHKALRPGLRLDAKIDFEKRENVLAIPRNYVTVEEGKYVVYKYESDGAQSRKAKQEVALGFRDGLHVEVLTGLVEGDRIVKPQRAATP